MNADQARQKMDRAAQEAAGYTELMKGLPPGTPSRATMKERIIKTLQRSLEDDEAVEALHEEFLRENGLGRS